MTECVCLCVCVCACVCECVCVCVCVCVYVCVCVCVCVCVWVSEWVNVCVCVCVSVCVERERERFKFAVLYLCPCSYITLLLEGCVHESNVLLQETWGFPDVVMAGLIYERTLQTSSHALTFPTLIPSRGQFQKNKCLLMWQRVDRLDAPITPLTWGPWEWRQKTKRSWFTRHVVEKRINTLQFSASGTKHEHRSRLHRAC